MTIPSRVVTGVPQWDANGEQPENYTFDSGFIGANRVLNATVIVEGQTADTVTYNGALMTKVSSRVNYGNEVSQWVLVNPATGSNTLAVTSSADPADITIHASVYQDAAQTDLIGNTGDGAGVSDSAGDKTFALTTTATDSIIITAMVMDGGNSVAQVDASTGMDVVSENAGDTGHTSRAFVTGVYEINAPTVQAYSVGAWIDNTGKEYAVVGFELKGVSSGSSVSKTATFLFNTQASVSKNESISWSTLGAVSRPETFAFHTLAPVMVSESFSFNRLQSVLSSESFNWLTLRAVTQSEAFSFNTLTVASMSESFSYDRYSAVAKSQSFDWSTEGVVSLTPVSKTLTSNWQTWAAVVNSESFNWFTLQNVGQSTSFDWLTLGAVSATEIFNWNTLQSISLSESMPFNVLRSVDSNQVFDWLTLQSVEHIEQFVFDRLGTVSITGNFSWMIEGQGELVVPLAIRIPAGIQAVRMNASPIIKITS